MEFNQQFNQQRRATLKKIAGTMAACAVLPLSAAANCLHSGAEGIAGVGEVLPLRGTGLVVSFSEHPETVGIDRVTVVNHTDAPVTLRKVYPGIVTSGRGTFDLNSLLADGPRTLEPGIAYEFEIAAGAVNAEPLLGAPGAHGQPLTVSTIHRAFGQARLVKTMRTLYS